LTNAVDLRVAAEHAIFGTPETQVGLLPGGGSLTRLAANGPLAVQKVKEGIMRSSGLSLDRAYQVENEVSAVVMQSKDAREGPRAFKQKREPNFIGE
jgi:enoyl-CoA hydratase